MVSGLESRYFYIYDIFPTILDPLSFQINLLKLSYTFPRSKNFEGTDSLENLNIQILTHSIFFSVEFRMALECPTRSGLCTSRPGGWGERSPWRRSQAYPT